MFGVPFVFLPLKRRYTLRGAFKRRESTTTLMLLIQYNYCWHLVFTETLEMTIEEVDPATLPKGKYDYLYEHVLRNLTNGVAIEPMASAIDWGMVVNVGKKIWEIVEKNQPTLQVQTSSASALPGGISDWKQMAGWQTPISRAYSITYTNLYTIKVVQFTFRVVFHYGGNYQGKGKYMTGITVIPSNIDVLWGYNFDCKVTVPEVLNCARPLLPDSGTCHRAYMFDCLYA
jgi:hypothetical protein